MRASLKKVALLVSTVCLIIVAVFSVLIYLHLSEQSSQKADLIIRLENAVLISVQKPTIPTNQSYVIVAAEHADMRKNDQHVNVTFVQTQNETQAYYLFQTIKSSFLVQGFNPQNLTSPFLAIELHSAERPTIILLQKENYVVMCQSDDLDLALEAANAQANKSDLE